MSRQMVGLAVSSPKILFVTAAVAVAAWTLASMLVLRTRVTQARRFLAEHPACEHPGPVAERPAGQGR